MTAEVEKSKIELRLGESVELYGLEIVAIGDKPYEFQDTAKIVEEMPIPDGAKKLCIFGSRTLWDCRVANAIADIINRVPRITTIVTTQEPRGVCEVAQVIAKESNLILELHFLDFKYKAGAFEHRSREAIKASDYVLLIHDGISHGTANELEYTKKLKKPYCYMKLTQSDSRIDRYIGKNYLTTKKEEELNI